MDRVRVRNIGKFGYDVNDDLTKPGLYTIPIPNYSDNETRDGYEWIDVDIIKVLTYPKVRGHVILGYDENNKSQMWYYNGNQKCFKRVFQDGIYGEVDKSEDIVLDFLVEDAELDENEAYEVSKLFLSL